MPTFQDLRERHLRALEGVEVGKLLILTMYNKPAEDERSVDETTEEPLGAPSDDDDHDDQDAKAEREGHGGEEVSSDEEDEDDANEIEEDNEDDEDDQAHGAASRSELESYMAAEGGVVGIDLYVVRSMTKDEAQRVTDINVELLTYCRKAADAAPSDFQIYGDSVLHSTKATSDDENQLIADILREVNMDFDIQLNPTARDFITTMFDRHCPASCNRGWLATQEEMHSLVTDTIRAVHQHEPVCPVCIGKPLMFEYQALRENLEDFGQVDIGMLVALYGRLNVRRRNLGYSFKQFDEREWGMMFDDMLQESDDEDGWQQSDEAMDPNADATYHPASAAAIAVLPQKKLAEVAGEGEQMACVVCMENFTDEKVLTQLPCGHVSDLECAQMWLKTSNSCPTCRKRLPAVEIEEVESDQESNVEGQDANEGSEVIKEADDGVEEDNEPGMDGEDVVMRNSVASIVA